jgi:hypothetical protein
MKREATKYNPENFKRIKPTPRPIRDVLPMIDPLLFDMCVPPLKYP